MALQGMPPVTRPTPAAAVQDSACAPEASSPAEVAAKAQLLSDLLITATEKTIREQRFGAAAGIMGGTTLIGLGAWRLAESPPQSQFSRGLGVMFMTLGAVDLTTGVFAAVRVSHEERRLARWEAAKKDGITEVELARAEGELLASSETRQGERMLVRWSGLTHALAGAIILGLSPVPNNTQRDRRSAWVIGGLFVATGTAAFGLSFRPTPSEVAWKTYQANQTPQTPQVSWQMSPSISRRGFGLGVSGTF